MKKKILKISIFIIIGGFLVYLFLFPVYKFRKNEEVFLNAAKEYYQMNLSKLPTGERASTLSLITLYRQHYLKEDFKIPFSTKLCSVKNSWIKVKKDSSGEYQYYAFLDCGILKSRIDHKGPEIVLNGSDNI